MKRSIYFVAFAVALLLLVAGIVRFSRENVEASLEAPITTGYEAALTDTSGKPKPIFRPKGTAPAVWGPGDLYTMLITGEESNNALFQFEAVVPKGGGPPPHVHSREDETSMWSAANWRWFSVTKPTTRRRAISCIFHEAPFTGSKTSEVLRLSSL